MCPHCGQNAPLVYRGVSAFCSACGGPRIPFTANAVNLKGKPAKIGGVVASVVGWIVLVAMLAAALIVGALLQAIFPPGAVVGWVIGGVIAAVGITVSLVLLLGGRALQRSGTTAAEGARLDALGTLAALNKGNVTSQSASEALGCSYQEADAFLTALAKRPESGVSLELDDEGKIFYRFARHAPPQAWPPEGKVRVDAAAPTAHAPPGAAPAPGVPTAAPALAAQEISPAAGTQFVAPQAAGGAAPARVPTEPMGLVPEHVRVPAEPTGPGGTKLVPVSPGTPAPREVVEIVNDEAAAQEAGRGRARS